MTKPTRKQQSADEKEIAAKKAILEKEMDEGIDSLCRTRAQARKSLGDDPMPSRLMGQGKRLSTGRVGTVLWTRKQKVRQGLFDWDG